MQIATLNDASNHGQELRHLTVHFRDLQGLRMAPFWGALLLLTILGKTGVVSQTGGIGVWQRSVQNGPFC
jgi:hypothetical protein